MRLKSGKDEKRQRRKAANLQRMWEDWSGSFPSFMEHLDTLGIPYLSHSKMATVMRCPRCYFKQYIEGESPFSEALANGLIFHEAAAAVYQTLRAGRANGIPEHTLRLSLKPPDFEGDEFLNNAWQTLLENLWEGVDIVGVEELFFMDLAPALPPVIGVMDLVVRQGETYRVVDHKTSKRFGDPDEDQLVLYAEAVRRLRGSVSCEGVFDEYRLVPNLKRVRTPVFRRTPVSVEADRVPDVVCRYREAHRKIRQIERDGHAYPGLDCWFCNPRQPRGY